jgi:hypothetical protein
MSARFFLKYAGGHEGLEYGIDHVTPVPWRIVRTHKAPRGAHGYVWELPAQLTMSETFRQYYAEHVGHEIYESFARLKALLRAMLVRKNPARRRARSTRTSSALSRSREVRQAASLSRRFSGMEPRVAGTVNVARLPRTAISIGYIDAVDYETFRHGEVQRFRHVFKKHSRPLFCVSPDGRQLLMLGGAFRFTARGIVDRSRRRK